MLGLVALAGAFGTGYGFAAYRHRATIEPAREIPVAAVAPGAIVKTPPPGGAPPVASTPPAVDANQLGGRNPQQQRAVIEKRVQSFMETLPPEQQALVGEMRQQVQKSAADWQKLNPEERQQRVAEFATNTLRMSPQDLQRLQSRMNPTPEQREQFRQRMQEFQNRPRQ